MSKYRIIEKKGRYTHVKLKSVYIPRYIVQELVNKDDVASNLSDCAIFKDLKEFNDLEEARAFKRDLELDDGIVIE